LDSIFSSFFFIMTSSLDPNTNQYKQVISRWMGLGADQQACAYIPVTHMQGNANNDLILWDEKKKNSG
jgi:hypothetical protein